MKKIIILICFIFSCMFCLTSYAEEKVAKITDTTSIKDDLTILGLDYNDYLISDENYSKLYRTYEKSRYWEQFVIAVGESYIEDDVESYIYVFSPLMYRFERPNVELNIKYKDICETSLIYHIEVEYEDWDDDGYYWDEVVTDYSNISPIKSDSNAYIWCFKVSLFKCTDLSRKYNITINNSGMKPFEAVFSTEINGNKRLNYFNYNSAIYITADKVVSCVFKDCVDIGKGIFKDVFTCLAGKNPYKNSVVYYYNFSSNKKIDKIISVDMSWVDNLHQSGYIIGGVPGSSRPVPIETRNERTERNETIMFDDIWNVKFWDVDYEFNPFMIPASNRIDEFPEDYKNNMSADQKKLFSDYQYSILFNVGEYDSHDLYPNNPFDKGKYFYNKMLLVEDVKMTKLEYEADGVLYQTIVVDTDGKDDGFNGADGEKPDIESPNAPDEFWTLVKEFLIKAFDTVCDWFQIKNISIVPEAVKMITSAVVLAIVAVFIVKLLFRIIFGKN